MPVTHVIFSCGNDQLAIKIARETFQNTIQSPGTAKYISKLPSARPGQFKKIPTVKKLLGKFVTVAAIRDALASGDVLFIDYSKLLALVT